MNMSKAESLKAKNKRIDAEAIDEKSTRPVRTRLPRSLLFSHCSINGTEKMQKTCSVCAKPAQFSIVAIVSTLGVSKRLQKSSPAVLFCEDCVRKLCEHLHSNELSKAVNSAYTALNQRLRER